jgi:hypothetical protein
MRVMVVEPPSDERRAMVADLLDLGLDVVMADDAGRALREIGEGVDVLILDARDRKLALESLVRNASGKRKVELFIRGGAGAGPLEIAKPLPPSGADAARDVAKALGLSTGSEGPKLAAEELLWSSPRSSVEIFLARKDGAELVAYLRTKCAWADDWRDAFVKSMQRAHDLGHARLGAIEVAWTSDADVNAISRLSPGHSLSRTLARGTLSLEEAHPIMAGLADALNAMHGAAEPVLFGPIGIGQVWLEATGPRFLFGGASRIANNHDRSLRGRMHLAIPMLSSPEELSGTKADPRSDVFYAGVFLYQLLTGSEPFPRTSVEEHVGSIRSGAFREITIYAPALHGRIARTLHAALSPDPASRPTPSDLAAVLEPQDRAPKAAAEPPRRKWWPFG